MSDGRHPPYDDGGGLPDTERRAFRPKPGADDADDPGAHSPGEAWEGEWEDDGPNYLVRRLIAIGFAVAVLGTLAVVIGRLVSGNGDDTPSTPFDPSWNTVAVLDTQTITLVDPDDGDEIETYDAPTDLLDAQSLALGNVLVVLDDAGRISQIDLTDGSIERDRAGPDETLVVSPDHPDFAVVAPDTGGDVMIVDVGDRSALSVADAAGLDAPLMFGADLRINPAGTHAAITDRGGRIQTLIIDLGDETVEVVGGQIVAINDEVVVTAQFAGDQTELEYWDLLGTRLESVDVPTPEVTMLTDDNHVVGIDATGTITVAGDDGDVDEVGLLTVEVTGSDATGGNESDVSDEGAEPLQETVEVTGGSAAFANRRLVVTTADHTFVVDDRGEQVGVVAGSPGAPITTATTCVVALADGLDGSSMVDLDDGTVLVRVPSGFVAASSLDGCTSAVQGTTPTVVRRGEIARVDLASITAVAPDGSHVVVGERAATSLVPVDELLAEDGDEPEPVELGRGDVVVRFVDR